MVAWPLPPELVFWVAHLSHAPARPACLAIAAAAPRAPLRPGPAHRRRLARAAGLGQDFRQYYYFLGSLGRKIRFVASLLLRLRRRHRGRRPPAARPGRYPHQALRPKGRGGRHPPQPQPRPRRPEVPLRPRLGDHRLARLPPALGRHRPAPARLVVRPAKDIAKLPRRYGVAFRTKLQMAADLVAWVAGWLRYLGKTLWVVADGAYAKRPFLKAAAAAGVVVVSRLRKDAALWTVPEPPRPGAPRGAARGPPTASRPSAWPSGRPIEAAGSRGSSCCTGRR